MAPSRRPPARPPRADVAVSALFLAASVAQVVVAPIASPGVSVAVAVGSTLPLAWRRLFPASAAVVMTGVWLLPTPGGFLLTGYVAAGLMFFSVGAHVRQLWRVVPVAAFGVAVGVLITLLGPEAPPAAIGSVLIVAGPVAAGRLVAHQRGQNARLRTLGQELVHERAGAERAAAAEERTRIARELHDVVGHGVTVIALQADAAAAALATAPERALAPVQAIRATAAQALAEMRRTVSLLRGPADDGELRPQPGIADVPALIEQSRAAGAQVELTFRPPTEQPAQSLQVTVYRLVQEALTNARHHAPGSSVDVRIEARDDALCIEVASRGGRTGRASGGGDGLVGMRERVRVHGGRLEAGATQEGFSVRARLPLAPQGKP